MNCDKSAFPGAGIGCTSWELSLVGWMWHWGTTTSPTSCLKFQSRGISPELQRISASNPHLFMNSADPRRGQEVWAAGPWEAWAQLCVGCRCTDLICAVFLLCYRLPHSISSALAFSFSQYRELICFRVRKQALFHLELMALTQIPQCLSGSTEQQNSLVPQVHADKDAFCLSGIQAPGPAPRIICNWENRTWTEFTPCQRCGF